MIAEAYRTYNLPRIYPPLRLMEQRPWGNFEQFVHNESCSVKVITVEAEQQLSLQSHTMRSEWWIVLDEMMEVEIDGERRVVYQGEHVFIPVGARHRAIGLGQACRWLEIAFGTFDEGDIERYEDSYGRL